MHLPPSTQMVLRDGYSEFGFGQPDPDLLPVAEMRRAPASAFDLYGTDATRLWRAGRRVAAAWLDPRAHAPARRPGRGLDECIGTAGNSDAIDQVCTLFTQPGDVVLVESPTYHLGLRILNDHQLDLRAIPTDARWPARGRPC